MKAFDELSNFFEDCNESIVAIEKGLNGHGEQSSSNAVSRVESRVTKVKQMATTLSEQVEKSPDVYPYIDARVKFAEILGKELRHLIKKAGKFHNFEYKEKINTNIRSTRHRNSIIESSPVDTPKPKPKPVLKRPQLRNLEKLKSNSKSTPVIKKESRKRKRSELFDTPAYQGGTSSMELSDFLNASTDNLKTPIHTEISESPISLSKPMFSPSGISICNSTPVMHQVKLEKIEEQQVMDVRYVNPIKPLNIHEYAFLPIHITYHYCSVQNMNELISQLNRKIQEMKLQQLHESNFYALKDAKEPKSLWIALVKTGRLMKQYDGSFKIKGYRPSSD